MANEDKNAESTGLKRILYLDRESINTILFDLDYNTTCETVFNEHKNSIAEIMNSAYKKNLEECEFLIMENKINRKIDDIPALMKIKIK